MVLLDGKLASQNIKKELALATDELIQKGFRVPHLAAILVGNDGASETYIASKVKSCAEIGYASSLIRLNTDIHENELLRKIEMLNNDDEIDGILVQLPLPKHISESKVINTIHPDKDVDGFHPVSIGRMVQGMETFIPATPYGIMLLLKQYNIDTNGKHAVVVGRSNIVGRPMSILLSSNLSQGNCTVTLCHRYTHNLKEMVIQADIVVAAVGKPGLITADMVKDGAVVIDIGITRVEDATTSKGYKLKGDVDFEKVSEKAFAITPVPGGVGPMTIAGLLKNTMQAYLRRSTIDLNAKPLERQGIN